MEPAEMKVILIAEDDPSHVVFLRHHLEKDGFRPLIVESGQEALRVATSNHPDVIVLDVGLPDMSGMEVCRALKQDRRTAEIPILFLTGHVDVTDRVAGLDAGAQDYLVKPFAMPELEARLRAILRKQEELQRDKVEFQRRQGEFLDIINHELRAPLTVISMASEILTGSQQMSDERRGQLIQSIRGSAGTLTSIVEDLLFLANPVRRLRNSDLRQVTQATVEEQRPHVHELGLHLVARLPAQGPRVMLDESQYRRALAHLIDNAIKFTPRGGAITVAMHTVDPTALPVSVAAEMIAELPPGLVAPETTEPWAILTVNDTGIGIAPEHHRQVFEPFYQVDSSTTRTAAGAGLGLAVVAAFVRAHHGHLAVRSGHGQGTAIHLALPLRQDVLPDQPVEDDEGPESA